MRTALTMLGVIIGVAAVIAMMEISQGASVAIQVTVTNMGANTLAGHSRRRSGGQSVRVGDSTDTVTPEDAEAIAPRVLRPWFARRRSSSADGAGRLSATGVGGPST